jgi:cobalt-zinc-cadmium efflux system protein
MFMRGRENDLNVKGAFLHMAGDAAVSGGVVVAGVIITLTRWHWVDPVMSIVINAVIVWSTWHLIRDATNLAMDAVPEGIDVAKVRNYLEHLPGICAVHDLHIWALSTTQTALTAHLVKPDARIDDGLLDSIRHELQERFRIGHATIQFESGDEAHPCDLAPSDVV